MKVKKIISEELMSLAELREILNGIRDKRSIDENTETEESQGRMMSYELRKSINHVDSLKKTDLKSSKALLEKLNGLEKMRPEIAYRIVNILPKTRDELRAIYAKECYNISKEELDQILEIIKECTE
ncbi:MAG TPA: RNA polymerase Rpb4 family protein [Methanocorpusculum sp.]|nr:RNA polymerase Rpb4 family protein [Methanocorpusculum sp.]